MNRSSLPVVGLDGLQEVVDHGVSYDAVRTALASILNGEIDAPEELTLKLRNQGELHIKGGWLASQP
jgi:hypothetical protein